jgi:hypothetical protein
MPMDYSNSQHASTTPDVPAGHVLAGSPERTAKLVELTSIGVLSGAIYLAYVMAFPLVPHTEGAHVVYDLEKLARDSRWLAILYFVGLVALFVMFWWAINVARAIEQARDTAAREKAFKLIVLAFGLLFGLTLVWLYPVTANDLFRYVLRGRIWAVHGASPMLHPPNDFPQDPYISFAGEFGDWVSGYGPLWEVLVQVPLRLGATDMAAGAVSLKFLALFFYLVSALLIGWTVSSGDKDGCRGQWTWLTGLLLFTWNPMVLIEGMGNGHNDMVLIALWVAGLLLWERKLWWAAAVALSLAAMTKATGLLMLPIFGIILLREETTWRRRFIKAAVAACIFLSLAYLSYRALGPVEETIRGVRDMLTVRRGYAIASAVRVVLREVVPGNASEPIPRTTGQYLFVLFYAGLLWRTWRGKLNLYAATFLTYFAQLIYGATFRVWYPIWLVPLAALYPAPAMTCRMLLFSFAGEMYVLNTFLWHWWLSHWEWVQRGLAARNWLVINLLGLPWFMIPLFGPIVMRWRRK